MLEEEPPCFSREVVAIKHKKGVWMAFLLHHIDPLLDHCVDRCGLLELLVGTHEGTVEKDGLSIWKLPCQLIDPKSNLPDME